MTTVLVRAAWKATPFKDAIRPVARRVRDSAWGPWNWSHTERACRILARDYGHLRSAAEMASIDAAGEPVPWFTYPAIEYLSRLDLRGKSVFEYGCGNSTRYWARHAAEVVSVEHDPLFYDAIKPQLPDNCELSLRRPAEAYISSIDAYSTRNGRQGFDVIVIDGHSRVRCAARAPHHLAPGGLVILDNADWFPEAAALLRRAGLLEVSFTGFAPICDCTLTTSFFFDRAFDMPMRPDRVRGIGSVPKPAFSKVP